MNASTEKARHIPLLDLCAQHVSLRESVLEALTGVVDSQKFILGEEVQAFEREVADYCQCRFAVGCASGSDALILALMAAGVGVGDRVITTPYTFFATAGAISRVGATPVFVDINPLTFNLDPDSVRAELVRDSNVRAIIPVHLFGACADMDAFCEMGQRYGATVIEDAAQAIGAEYHNARAGSLGAMGCFSFFPSKNLGGYGDGGMITTNDESLAKKLLALRIHGRTGKYLHDWIGINSRLDSIQAAVLRVKFRWLDEWTRRRQENAELYRNVISARQIPVVAPHPTPEQTRHVYNQFTIRCSQRDQLQVYLKEKGIGSEVYYPLPLHLQKCYADLGHKAGDFPRSEKLSSEALSLPVNPEVSHEDVIYICEALQAFYE